MANELSSQTRLTNRFLKNIEQWNEREVNDYKRKVGFELTEAWTEAIIVFALMFTVLGYAWAFNRNYSSEVDERHNKRLYCYRDLSVVHLDRGKHNVQKKPEKICEC